MLALDDGDDGPTAEIERSALRVLEDEVRPVAVLVIVAECVGSGPTTLGSPTFPPSGSERLTSTSGVESPLRRRAASGHASDRVRERRPNPPGKGFSVPEG
ncbi:hypothetical protein ACFQE1_19415 [Halobium palmae]|uniref:Uncharacterized protein n=1 Tax=Halobium palmae TaxID=1776492 RepID=A0ABD5S4R0_9EURY